MRNPLYIVVLVVLFFTGCASTAPVADRGKWGNLSSSCPDMEISWLAPESVTPTKFSRHIKHFDDLDSDKIHSVIWWKGYDVNSGGLPAFVVQISLSAYSGSHNATPSLNDFRKEQAEEWSNTSHVMEELALGSFKWLKIVADYGDKLNACQRVQFQVPINYERYLNVIVEYDNEMRDDAEWLASRQAVVSDIVRSLRVRFDVAGSAERSSPIY
jgi:hypothetical protein